MAATIYPAQANSCFFHYNLGDATLPTIKSEEGMLRMTDKTRIPYIYICTSQMQGQHSSIKKPEAGVLWRYPRRGRLSTWKHGWCSKAEKRWQQPKMSVPFSSLFIFNGQSFAQNISTTQLPGSPPHAHAMNAGEPGTKINNRVFNTCQHYLVFSAPRG